MRGRKFTACMGSTALAGCLAAAVLGAPAPARADADSDAKIQRLLELLVQKKIVSPRQANALLKETNTPRSRGTAREAEEAPPPAKKGEIRVTYVPQFIRRQIADEVRAQVLTEQQQETWSGPPQAADWTRRIRVYGDMRARYERDSFGSGNYNDFVNFADINNGSAFDFLNYGAGNAAPPPFLDTTEDRDRARVRARIGIESTIDSGWTANIRIGTGSDQGPVTPNQTLGAPGDFSKYQAWIDRAYFTYKPFDDLAFYAGREPNPFFTTDLIFYSDLGFDGIAAQYSPRLSPTVSLFLDGGAFPILNTAFDFSTDDNEKYGSDNGYLLAVQGGVDWQMRQDVDAKLGVGFFDFTGVQGAVSAPCLEQQGATFACSTDNTRFPYQQFGNTVYAIRNIDTANQTPNSSGLYSQPQYFGLASRFAVLEVHPKVVLSAYDPIDFQIEGEYLKNLAYDRAAILAHGAPGFVGPQNNFGPNSGPYEGGDTAYTVRATLGQPEIHLRWDWNVSIGYKYLETDATLDSIDDADFHLGGTNAKGYILTGSLGVARNTFLSLRYFAAHVVSGPPDSNQVFQLDLQSSF